MLVLFAASGAASAQTKAPVAPAPPSAPTSARLAVLERLPDRIGSYARSGPARRATTPNVENGATLRYNGASEFMIVFLYRMSAGPAIPDGTESPVVQAELAASERSMLNAMVQVGQDGVSRAPAELVTGYAFTAPDGPHFRCVEAPRAIAAPRGGAGAWHQHEHVCVTGHPQGYLKMRATYRAPGPESDQVRDAGQALIGRRGLGGAPVAGPHPKLRVQLSSSESQ